MDGNDEDLQRALQLSAQQHMATATTLVLEQELQVPRREFGAPNPQHWKGRWQPQEGVMLQVDTLNQFSQHWLPLIQRFGAASSICGYMAMANAMLVHRAAPASGSWSRAQLDDLVGRLRDPKLVEPVVAEVMEFVSRSRRAWMEKTPQGFESDADRRRYLLAWVANYEISDFLRHEAEAGRMERAGVFFARYNQWPERASATHEEWHRLAEEQRFGGWRDAMGASHFDEGDSEFLVERFRPKRELRAAGDFLAGWEADARPPAAPSVFIADLNGHFVVCIAICLDMPEGGTKNAVVVVNTTGTRYVDYPTCALAFDLAFPPSPGGGAEGEEEGVLHPAHRHPLVAAVGPQHVCDVCGAFGTAYRCAEGCDFDLCRGCYGGGGAPGGAVGACSASDAAVEDLVGMGFSEGDARKALLAAGGCRDRAVELLLAGA